MLSNELKGDLVSVSRKNDRVMSIELVLCEMVVNIIMIMLFKWVVKIMKNKRFENIWTKSRVRHRIVKA